MRRGLQSELNEWATQIGHDFGIYEQFGPVRMAEERPKDSSERYMKYEDR